MDMTNISASFAQISQQPRAAADVHCAMQFLSHHNDLRINKIVRTSYNFINGIVLVGVWPPRPHIWLRGDHVCMFYTHARESHQHHHHQ